MSTPLNIALVEDHESLRVATARFLRDEGHHVYELECAEDMDEVVGGAPIDLYLIDLNLPGEDGLRLAQRLRATHPQVGIIALTARAGGEHMAASYKSGADMHLTKPVTPELLQAAIASLRRRLPGGVAAPPAFLLDMIALRLQGPKGQVPLSAGEVAVLAGLMRAPRHCLDSFQIATLMGQPEERINKSALEIRLARLRKKLVSIGADTACLKAQRGVGYQLCMPVRLC